MPLKCPPTRVRFVQHDMVRHDGGGVMSMRLSASDEGLDDMWRWHDIFCGICVTQAGIKAPSVTPLNSLVYDTLVVTDKIQSTAKSALSKCGEHLRDNEREMLVNLGEGSVIPLEVMAIILYANTIQASCSNCAGNQGHCTCSQVKNARVMHNN